MAINKKLDQENAYVNPELPLVAFAQSMDLDGNPDRWYAIQHIEKNVNNGGIDILVTHEKYADPRKDEYQMLVSPLLVNKIEIVKG